LWAAKERSGKGTAFQVERLTQAKAGAATDMHSFESSSLHVKSQGKSGQSWAPNVPTAHQMNE
jgi:hypothetical protein